MYLEESEIMAEEQASRSSTEKAVQRFGTKVGDAKKKSPADAGLDLRNKSWAETKTGLLSVFGPGMVQSG